MRFAPRRFASVLVVIAGIASCALSPGSASAGPYRGRVIDAETKEPLVGAVVLVYWNLFALVPGHPERFLDAEEALTDGRGEFSIGAHPPSAPLPGTKVSEPHISILKPGYAPFPYGHTAPPWPPRGYEELLGMMQQSPILIELPRLKTQAEARRMLDLVNPLAVPQERIPRMIETFDAARRQLYQLP